MTPAAPVEQSPYWDKCKEMDFGQLRQFIDNSLQELSVNGLNDCPRSKEEFLTLWEMLRGKIYASDLPEILPDPGNPPEFLPFAPSEQLKQQLKPLLDQQEQLTAKLVAARNNPSTKRSIIKKLRYRLHLLELDITSLEGRERQDYAKRRDAYLRRYWEAKRAHERSIRQRDEEGQRRRQLRPRHLQFAERVRGDIERAFEFGAILPTSRLPWRVLPAGELSLMTFFSTTTGYNG